jgi:acyl dehydratase
MRYYEDFKVNIPHTSECDYEVTKEAIIDFASQWDPMPFHLDEEVAKASPLGKLFASSIHTVAIGVKLAHTMMEEEAAIVAGLGWDELRFLVPVCVGDCLRVRSQLVSKRESRSQPDRGILVALNEVLNQQGEVVASYKMTSMVLKRGEG